MSWTSEDTKDILKKVLATLIAAIIIGIGAAVYQNLSLEIILLLLICLVVVIATLIVILTGTRKIEVAEAIIQPAMPKSETKDRAPDIEQLHIINTIEMKKEPEEKAKKEAMKLKKKEQKALAKKMKKETKEKD